MNKKYLLLLLSMLVACSVQRPLTEAQSTQSLVKDIPFPVTDIKQVKPGIYLFHCDELCQMLPDYEVDNEGVETVWRTTFSNTHDKQPHNIIWRNIVISKPNRRVLCIDRLIKDGKSLGYLYVIQGEDDRFPQGCHWDVTDHRLMLSVANILENITDLSVEMLNSIVGKK